MRTAGTIPEPDGNDSTPNRPTWQPDTIHRWLPTVGRRPDTRVASWLIPGPDRPEPLTLVGSVEVADLPSTTITGAGPVRVAVQRFEDRTNHPRRQLWLVTPLGNHDGLQLRSGAPGHRPIDGLITQLVRSYQNYGNPDYNGHFRGTVVIAPTILEDGTYIDPGCAWDVYNELNPVNDDMYNGFHHRDDITAALGFPVPVWPRGCATAELVATVTNRALTGASPLTCAVPVSIEADYKFGRTATALAPTDSPLVAAGLAHVTWIRWTTAVRHLRDGLARAADMKYIPAFTLPDDIGEMFPDPVETDEDAASNVETFGTFSAAEFAAIWACESTEDNIPAWFAEEMYRYLGNPRWVGVIRVNINDLPPVVTRPLDNVLAGEHGGQMVSCSLQQTTRTVARHLNADTAECGLLSTNQADIYFATGTTKKSRQVALTIPRAPVPDEPAVLDVHIVHGVTTYDSTGQECPGRLAIITFVDDTFAFLPVTPRWTYNREPVVAAFADVVGSEPAENNAFTGYLASMLNLETEDNAPVTLPFAQLRCLLETR